MINITICLQQRDWGTAKTLYSKPHKQGAASRIAPTPHQQLQCSTASPESAKDIKELTGDWGNWNTGREEAQKGDFYCSVTLYYFLQNLNNCRTHVFIRLIQGWIQAPGVAFFLSSFSVPATWALTLGQAPMLQGLELLWQSLGTKLWVFLSQW